MDVKNGVSEAPIKGAKRGDWLEPSTLQKLDVDFEVEEFISSVGACGSPVDEEI
jgi:hypothetical protein